MSETLDLLITNGHVLVSDEKNPEAPPSQQKINIGVTSGKISYLGTQTPEAKEVFSAEGLHILPGIIDSQVHFREPGMTHKEDFDTGTRSAIQGGVTAVFDMPNTHPNTATKKDFEEKMELVGSKAHCDFGLFMGVTNDNPRKLPKLEKLPGCCGLKIFMGSSTGDLLVSEDEYLQLALENISRPVAVHCEDEQTLIKRKHLAVEKASPLAHPLWRDKDSAFIATKRIVEIAKRVNTRIHVLHITTKQELEFLKGNKDSLTVECLPQHLFFHAPDCYEKLGTLAQMNPPIRVQEHQEALWKAIEDGTVDVIGSDHAPHTLEEKNKTYPNSPSGMPGVQTILPIMLNFVNQERLSLEKLTQLLSINPARLYSAQGKGGIFMGQDADFSIVDMKAKKTIENSWIESRSGWTPYDGVTVTGWPIATIIRGQTVMKEGTILQEKAGKAITFGENTF